jgi:hypothetical protein
MNTWGALDVGAVVLVLLNTLAVVGVLRRLSPVLARVEILLRDGARSPMGLPVGSSVPAFTVNTESGTRLADEDLANGRWLVLFLSDHCAPCRALAQDLSASERWLEIPARVAVVVAGPEEGAELAIPADLTLVAKDGRRLVDAFASTATPQAFAVENGIVVGVNHHDSVDALVALFGDDPSRGYTTASAGTHSASAYARA